MSGSIVFVEMAQVVAAVGLRGEIKLLVTGSFDERILRSAHLRMQQPGRDDDGAPCRCTAHRWKGSTVIARLTGIDDRGAAEAALGSRLGFRAADYDEPGFPREDRMPAWRYLDLMVVTTDGRTIGRVDDVWTLPANWVLRVLADEDTDEEREVLIPVIDDVIREIDRASGRVVIEPLPGLLSDFETA